MALPHALDLECIWDGGGGGKTSEHSAVMIYGIFLTVSVSEEVVKLES